MSQSIKSDHISESTVARITGNLLSGTPQVWLAQSLATAEGAETLRNQRRRAVEAAVATARLIAEVVQETGSRLQDADDRARVAAIAKALRVPRMSHDERLELADRLDMLATPITVVP